TGVVDVMRHTTVDDVGRAVNPMILHGQAHGGIAAGIGQALWELCAYDEATGQITAATLMDYALPRADALPSFVTELSEVPSTSNPLGLRGGGEGGATPALGPGVNAAVDDTFAIAERCFARPEGDKLALKVGKYNIGYLPFGGQVVRHSPVNKNTRPNFSESFYITRDRAPDHPDIVNEKPLVGLNRWPE